MQPKAISISLPWVKRAAYLYLLIPFLLFCLGFLRLSIALPVCVLLVFLLVKNWKTTDAPKATLPVKSFLIAAALVFLWVLLSGIGGFAFQNTDFHTRNAIFHDLIEQNWPVTYHSNPSDPSITYLLTYYIGYWLPAALIGKIAGWQAANVALYLWTAAGILLAVLLLPANRKLSMPWVILLFIFFSGMDWVGQILNILALPNYAGMPFWPPLRHLEWWATRFQYSSFTTQLFWVFNQAVPAWLCMALFCAGNERKTLFVPWSLCCFYAPLPAIGMLPFILLKIPRRSFDPQDFSIAQLSDRGTALIKRIGLDVRDVLTLENVLGGGCILLLTFLYFSANVQVGGQAVNGFPLENWILYPIFLTLEGFLIWLLFKDENRKNLYWYLAGLLLVTIPLFKIGSSQDFCMRASIPTLFLLFVWSAQMLAGKKSRYRTILIVLLCIGALNPFYEISRSVYRTTRYFTDPPSQAQKLESRQVRIYQPYVNDFDHPYTLTADSFKSLANFDPEQITNFLAKVDHTFFGTYLMR